MTGKPNNSNERIPVTLSLKRSLVRKLSDKARAKGSVSMTSRSRVAEELLEKALR